MINFAAKLPRLASLALSLPHAGNPMRWSRVRAEMPDAYKSALEAALADVPALGWDAPYSLLALVQAVRDTRKAAGPMMLGFDEKGCGPFCAHGAIPIFCPTCTSAEEAEERLLAEVDRLARAA